MPSPLLQMRRSNLGKNHLQTLRWLKREGWKIGFRPDAYLLSHPTYGTIPTPIELQLRSHPSSDLDTLQQIFVEMQYLPAVQAMLQHSPSCHNPLIIDGGANAGLCTVFLARLFPNHRIIAVEPFSENVEVMRRNFERASITGVEIFEGALWGHAARLQLNRAHGDGREWAASVIELGSGWIEGATVEQLVNRYFPGSPIDLLKLDIEGAEFSVLNDPATERFIVSNVRVLTMEVHPGFGDIPALLERYSAHFALEKLGEDYVGYNRQPVVERGAQ